MSERDLVAIVLEDVSRKFDLILESHEGVREELRQYREESNERFERVEAAIRFTNVDLRQRIDGVEERLTKRIDAVEVKLDAVADDVAAHRADTESHMLYRVKEEGGKSF